MREISIKRSDVERLARTLSTPGAELSSAERALAARILAAVAEAIDPPAAATEASRAGTAARSGKRLALAAGCAALLLTGASSPAESTSSTDAGTGRLGSSIHDQFLTAFTQEVVDLGPGGVESVKLGE